MRTVAFDLLTIVGMILLFSDTPLYGMLCIFIALCIWFLFCAGEGFDVEVEDE